MTKTYELIELDPATGEEGHLIAEGTMAQMEKARAAELEDMDDYETWGSPFPTLMIRPVA